MYRITRTDYKSDFKWYGFCTVVSLGDKLKLPNGDTYDYELKDKGIYITEGPHEGFYSLEALTQDILDSG